MREREKERAIEKLQLRKIENTYDYKFFKSLVEYEIFILQKRENIYFVFSSQ